MYQYITKDSPLHNRRYNFFCNNLPLQRWRPIQLCGQQHHVIPLQLKDFCDQRFEAGYTGLRFDTKTIVIANHRGCHPHYTETVRTALEKCENDNVKEFADNLATFIKDFDGDEKLNNLDFSDIQSLIPSGSSQQDKVTSSYGRELKPVKRLAPSPRPNSRASSYIVAGHNLRPREK